jgi:hypothetical protein
MNDPIKDNSIHNISKAIENLQRERWVLLFEVSQEASELIDQLVGMCHERINDLHDEYRTQNITVLPRRPR